MRTFYFVLWFLLLLFFLAYFQCSLFGRRLDVYHTSAHDVASANLECMSEMCCMRLAAKWRKNRLLRTIMQFVGLYLRNEGMHWQSKKNLLNINICRTCPQIMVNFGPLAALISKVMWRIVTKCKCDCNKEMNGSAVAIEHVEFHVHQFTAWLCC